MSLDLTFLPVDHDQPTWGFSHSMIQAGAGAMWYEALKDCIFTGVPKDFKTFTCREGGEPHYGDTQRTPYGEPLLCVTARQIINALNMHGFWEMSSKDQAAFAYIQQLPREQRVALYWH